MHSHHAHQKFHYLGKGGGGESWQWYPQFVTAKTPLPFADAENLEITGLLLHFCDQFMLLFLKKMKEPVQ